MKNLLKKIIDTPIAYGRFLNTLSMLEYVGARKIIKSQRQEDINEQTLAHVVKEIRHALTIKSAAKENAHDICDTYIMDGLLCGFEAYRYFQTMECAVQEELADQPNFFHVYLYTTVILQTRGIMFYSLVDEVLQELDKPTVFGDIIIEETQHLEGLSKVMHTLPNFDLTIGRLRSIEEPAFGLFLRALGVAIGYEGDW